MEWFAEARNENIHKSVPYQVIAMGTQWTPPVLSFTQAYMLDPTIVITSRFEAAIYGKVTQVHIYLFKLAFVKTSFKKIFFFYFTPFTW